MVTSSASCVIVGAGLAGAATAWRLASSGVEVVVLEGVAPAHAGGSSHGSARIFRHAYPDPWYVGLTLRALTGWRELETVAGRSVLTVTGGLDFGRRRGVGELAASLASAQIDHELLDPAVARDRWPHLVFDSPVMFQPGAGVIDAETAVASMLEQARVAGAVVAQEWVVERVEHLPTGLRVSSTDGRRIDAGVLVVAAGGWLPELLDRLPLPQGFRAAMPPLRVTQQQAFHFRFPDATAPLEDPHRWPVLVHKDARSVYALPGGRDAGGVGFKIAEHDAGRATTATTRDGVVDPVARASIVEYVSAYLPDVDPTPYAETTCLYTSTPTEDFVIDRAGDIVIASPCSGHGAKFAPLIGELVADLVTGASAPETRFAVGPHGATGARH